MGLFKFWSAPRQPENRAARSITTIFTARKATTFIHGKENLRKKKPEKEIGFNF